ncbi:MAG: hypothetical protein JEZ11_17045 [Desulfobacterales bacterium]|nr:hypothetical protein [Desulfobacterales bacterium]
MAASLDCRDVTETTHAGFSKIILCRALFVNDPECFFAFGDINARFVIEAARGMDMTRP